MLQAHAAVDPRPELDRETGDFFSAEEAQRCNFVNAVHPPEGLREATTALAERIAAGPLYRLVTG